MIRNVGVSLAVSMPILGGCSAPIGRTNDTSDTTADQNDAWGLSVAVGPDERLVFELGTDVPLRIQPGTTVTFEWHSDGHDIHVASQPSGANWNGHDVTEDAGFIHEHTFVIVGQYHFWCERHRQDGMVGDILVGDCDCGPPT